MTPIYRDYFWKDGIPCGYDLLKNPAEAAYKIVMDPYRKRISLERYAWGEFQSLVYDSAFLDFRSLKAENQLAWERRMIAEDTQKPESLIRNQDDRVILKEQYQFKNHRCIECRILSPHEVLIAIQRMYYEDLHDPFNGVILFDANEYPVMRKTYAMNKTLGEFGELLKEEWDMQHFKAPAHG